MISILYIIYIIYIIIIYSYEVKKVSMLDDNLILSDKKMFKKLIFFFFFFLWKEESERGISTIYLSFVLDIIGFPKYQENLKQKIVKPNATLRYNLH